MLRRNLILLLLLLSSHRKHRKRERERNEKCPLSLYYSVKYAMSSHDKDIRGRGRKLFFKFDFFLSLLLS
jgi:hypothetical protein